MSEPWIRFYDGDVRGDPKIVALSPPMRWALVIAWGLAKNGPGDVAELRSSDGSAMGLVELRRLASVDPNETRAMFQRWARLDLCVLVDEGDELVCTFPSLAKRQGIDRTAAQRKRRERERKRHGKVTAMSRQSHGESHGSMSRHVTGENQSTEEKRSTTSAGGLSEPLSSSNPLTPKIVTPVWAAYVEHHPQATLTKSRQQLIRRRLAEHPAEKLVAAIEGNHRDPWCNGENPSGKTYHALELILRDAEKIEKYASVPAMNGAKPKRTMAEIDKLAAEHGWNGADVETPEPEDLPF